MNGKALVAAILIGMGVTVLTLIVVHHIAPETVKRLIYGGDLQPRVPTAAPTA